MGLFKKNTNNSDDISKKNKSKNDNVKSISDIAYSTSVSQQGDPIVLMAALKNLYSSFEKKCREDENLQEEMRKPIREKIEKIEKEILGLSNKRDVYTDQEIKDLKEQIKECQEAISNVDSQPKKYGVDTEVDPTVKTYFNIGVILLTCIGIFLSIFYISASYSAFFKKWEEAENTGFGAKIFDGSAFVNAWQDDITVGLFVTLTFVIFLGLGYLLHIVQKESGRQKWIKFIGLLVITFIFDCILAYKIENEIFELTRVYGESFSLSIAFTKVDFWAIIFSGFVTYLIWGYIFDVTMKNWEKFSPLHVFKREKRNEKKVLEDELKVRKGELNLLNKEIQVQESLLGPLNDELEKVVIPVAEYKNWHDNYTLSWLTGITACSLSENKKEDRKGQCSTISHDFYSQLNS